VRKRLIRGNFLLSNLRTNQLSVAHNCGRQDNLRSLGEQIIYALNVMDIITAERGDSCLMSY
jgi:hypothetical protein